MAQATFRHGNPLMVDYTPGSAVAAGEVVVVGDLALVAHEAIAANAKGAVGAGGGVYRCTANAAIAVGVKVYWDNTANKVTTSAAAGANKVFGYVAPSTSSAADGDLIDVIHQPEVA